MIEQTTTTDNANDIARAFQAQPFKNHHKQVVVKVANGASSWDPASTKRAIYGPATVVYSLFSDGGIHAEVQR